MRRDLLIFTILVFVFCTKDLWARPDPANRGGNSCQSCHDDGAANFLTQDFTDGDDLIADAVYTLNVAVPVGNTRVGIHFEVVAYNDGVGGATVGSFLTTADPNSAPLANVTGNANDNGDRDVAVGDLDETHTGVANTTRTFFWKAPSAGSLPDGVRFNVSLVDASAGNTNQQADASVNTVRLGVTSLGGGPDPDPDPNPPPQDAQADAQGVGATGGAFGGNFGCGRVIPMQSQNSGLDVGFVFILAIGLLSSFLSLRSRKKLQKARSKSS